MGAAKQAATPGGMGKTAPLINTGAVDITRSLLYEEDRTCRHPEGGWGAVTRVHRGAMVRGQDLCRPLHNREGKVWQITETQYRRDGNLKGRRDLVLGLQVRGHRHMGVRLGAWNWWDLVAVAGRSSFGAGFGQVSSGEVALVLESVSKILAQALDGSAGIRDMAVFSQGGEHLTAAYTSVALVKTRHLSPRHRDQCEQNEKDIGGRLGHNKGDLAVRLEGCQ